MMLSGALIIKCIFDAGVHHHKKYHGTLAPALELFSLLRLVRFYDIVFIHDRHSDTLSFQYNNDVLIVSKSYAKTGSGTIMDSMKQAKWKRYKTIRVSIYR